MNALRDEDLGGGGRAIVNAMFMLISIMKWQSRVKYDFEETSSVAARHSTKLLGDC